MIIFIDVDTWSGRPSFAFIFIHNIVRLFVYKHIRSQVEDSLRLLPDVTDTIIG